MRSQRVRNDGGFTFVELVTVVVILAILVAVAIASYMVATDRAYRIACLSDQNAIRNALLQYEVAKGARPQTLGPLLDSGLISNPDGFGCCPADPSGTPYVYDPATGDVNCPRHPTAP